MNKLIVCLCLICFHFQSFGQLSPNFGDPRYQGDFQQQRNKIAFGNILTGMVYGGVGAILNKEKGEDFIETLGKGAIRGALGGTIWHFSMKSSFSIVRNQNIALAWPVRLLNNLGTNIVRNASLNNKMFEDLSMNFWVFRARYNTQNSKFKLRFDVNSLIGIMSLSRLANFDFAKSLQTGVIYFGNPNALEALPDGAGAGGRAYINSVAMYEGLPEPNYSAVFAHELMHVMQFERSGTFNTWGRSLEQRILEKSRFYKTVQNFIYLDMAFVPYILRFGSNKSAHQCRRFEQEAENYSTRRFYGCNF